MNNELYRIGKRDPELEKTMLEFIKKNGGEINFADLVRYLDSLPDNHLNEQKIRSVIWSLIDQRRLRILDIDRNIALNKNAPVE